MKEVLLRCNKTTTYIEHKHRNTETRALINACNVEKQYH